MRRTLLLTLALLAGCSSSVDRSGEVPPVAADFDSLVALCTAIALDYEDGPIGITRVTYVDEDFVTLREWVRDCGDADLQAEVADHREADWNRVVQTFLQRERRGTPVPVETYADGEVHSFHVAYGMEGEVAGSALAEDGKALVAYRKVGGEWRMTMLPTRVVPDEFVALPVSAQADPTPDALTSPLLYVRSFPEGGVPDDARQAYIDMGTMIPGDGPWQDVTWRGNPIYYPQCDPLGRTDPIGPRGQPDFFAQLEETITDQWMPYMSAEIDPSTGRMLMADPVTLRVERTADAEFLGQVARVFARRNVMLRHVHLRVASTEAPGAHHIALRQPLGWLEQEASPVVAAGASESEVTAALASMQDGRAGVRTTAGATVQQLVDTLDLLAAHGATDLYLAVLPEGYEAIPKD